MNTFDLGTLDLDKRWRGKTVIIRQGDKSGTTISASLRDHGAAVTTSGLTARWQMRLPNGSEYYRKNATYSTGTISITIDETTAASVAGVTEGYFQVLSGSTVIASTEPVKVVILPDALSGATVPSSYDSAIQDAIDALDAAVDDMPEMVEDVLEDHPEWTTTVQNGSVTDAKLVQSGGVLDRVGRLQYRLANLLTNTLAESELASATDAAKTPAAGLSVYGRSTQDGTPTPSAPVSVLSVGALNVAQFANPSEVTKTGITFTPLDDALGASGTSTSNSFIATAWRTGVLPAGKHMASVRLVSGTCTSFKCRVGRGATSGSYVTEAFNVGDEAHVWFTTNGTDSFAVAPSIPSDAVATNAVFVAQIERGQIVSPYVPYGHAGLWARGLNLIPNDLKAIKGRNTQGTWSGDTYTLNGVSFAFKADGSVTVNGTASALTTPSLTTAGYSIAAGTYCLSGCPSGGGTNTFRLDVLQSSSTTIAADNGSGASFTISETTAIDSIRIRVPSGATVSNKTFWPMLSVGTEVRGYQPYSESISIVDLDGNELRSLPDGTRDELKVDAYGHATLTKRVGSATYDGTENWSLQSGTYPFIAVGSSTLGAVGGKPLMSNLLAYTGQITVDGSGDGLSLITSGATLRIRATGYSTADAWKSKLAETPMTVLYPLATPQTIDLGYVDAVPLQGPDLTARTIPSAQMRLTYERDMNVTLARLESAIATFA